MLESMLKYYIGVPLVLIILAVAYYAISPLFRNVTVDEAVPGQVFAPEMEMNDAMPQTTQTTNESATLGASVAVEGTLGHPASGTVRIVEADGTRYVRYENFKTINGPDIYVYLAKDLDASEFVDLGRVKATEGNINYEIPAGIDPREYPYVLTRCKAFGVLFNSAKVF